MRRLLLLFAVAFTAFGVVYSVTRFVRYQPDPPEMVLIPGGEFTMGTDAELGWADKKPAHRVKVDSFWMDETEVTNAQFQALVDSTSYVTTAEKTIDVESLLKQSPPGTQAPPPEKLAPGSLIFTPPTDPVNLKNFSQWWKWTPGSRLEAPRGAGQQH